MLKPFPIWQDLPRHLKIYIAENLGDKSRSSLARCSKADLEITQAIPFNIKSITIVALDEIAWVYHVATYAYQSKRVLMGANTAINTFLNFFKHPKSEVDSVNFESKLDNNYTTFILMMKSKNIKIRSEKFRIERSANYVTRDYLELLKLFDVNTLKLIELLSMINDDLLSQLVKTEQWKSANEISVGVYELDKKRLDDFLHFNLINIGGPCVYTDENKEKLVENYLSRDRPINSFFFLYNFSAANPNFTADRPDEEDFDMPTKGNKLHIKMCPMKMLGRVIGKTKETDDLLINELLYQFYR